MEPRHGAGPYMSGILYFEYYSFIKSPMDTSNLFDMTQQIFGNPERSFFLMMSSILLSDHKFTLTLTRTRVRRDFRQRPNIFKTPPGSALRSKKWERGMQSSGFDIAIVGAGIVGLAHALAAVKAGKRVVVIDRDPRANGASIRNFGFITVTGQERGESWSLAMRTRDVWAEVAAEAGIPIEHEGLYLTGRSPEAMTVIEAFLATEMGEGCS